MACAPAATSSSTPSVAAAAGSLTPTPKPTPAPSASPSHTAAAVTNVPSSLVVASPLIDVPTWSAIEVSAGPSARSDHTWTVDDSGDVAYLFGGLDSSGPSNELWQLDLASDRWTRLEPGSNAPAPRFGHTATWVPGVGLVVWSGQGKAGFFDDIWAFDPAAATWRLLASGGDVPPARYGSCASLGPKGRLWISHGFTEDSGRFSDTRVYDFTSGLWTDVTPAGDVPVKRCLQDCFWSDEGDAARLILYGGQTTGVPALGDIWALDVVAGAWRQGPEGAAPPRQLYALAKLESGALVFGGGGLDGSYLNDAWLVNEQSLELSAVSITAAPPARSGATLIHDAKRGSVLLFGGLGQDGPLADMWRLVGLPSV